MKKRRLTEVFIRCMDEWGREMDGRVGRSIKESVCPEIHN